MELAKLVDKYGKTTDRFVGNKVRGIINGYSFEVDSMEYGYTLYLYLNGGIRKFFETKYQLESYLASLR